MTMPLPPTIDEAIKLIRRQHGKVTVGQLADEVIDHGWNVDRSELIERIRAIFPPRPAATPSTVDSQPQVIAPSAPPQVQEDEPKERTRKPNAKEAECPRCHADVRVTRRHGALRFTHHLRKNGEQCPMSGKSYLERPEGDVMNYRLPGSFGSGKKS